MFLLLILFLSFPLFDIEYSKRFSLLLFIPQSILLLLLYTFISARHRYIPASLVAFVTVVSIIFMTGKTKAPAITMDAFVDLQKLASHIEKPEDTLIIARHGLEWWTAWQWHTKVAQDKAIDKEVFAKYATVIVLQQKKASTKQALPQLFFTNLYCRQTGRLFLRPTILAPMSGLSKNAIIKKLAPHFMEHEYLTDRTD